jgi:hypothetical protein
VKRDMKDWDIVKDLVIDMAAWKLAMHVPKH